MRPRPLSLALASSLFVASVCVADALAQDVPKAEYSIKEYEARLGTRIRRDQIHGSSVAVNLPYAQLSEQDKASLHAWWENIAPGDEPPFPVHGLRELYDPLRKAGDVFLDAGKLVAVATVGPDGKVLDVRVFEAPSKKMGDFVARVLLLTDFKPAICSGVPCRMEYPLRMTFTVTLR